jgi:hypothetical protein
MLLRPFARRSHPLDEEDEDEEDDDDDDDDDDNDEDDDDEDDDDEEANDEDLDFDRTFEYSINNDSSHLVENTLSSIFTLSNSQSSDTNTRNESNSIQSQTIEDINNGVSSDHSSNTLVENEENSSNIVDKD